MTTEPEERGVLTAAGWPRPLNDAGLPVPWVSPSESLGVMNSARYNSCSTGAICAVCGVGYGFDESAYVLANAPPEEAPADLTTWAVSANDNAVLHEQCLALALARCPSLRRQTDDGALTVVRVAEALDSDPVDKGDHFQAIYGGEQCTVVGTPAEFLAGRRTA